MTSRERDRVLVFLHTDALLDEARRAERATAGCLARLYMSRAEIDRRRERVAEAECKHARARNEMTAMVSVWFTEEPPQ